MKLISSKKTVRLLSIFIILFVLWIMFRNGLGFDDSVKTIEIVEPSLGLPDKVKIIKEQIPAKEFWDWLQLLIVPVVLTAVGIWFSQVQKKTELTIAQEQKQNELAIAQDQQRETILQNYLDRMSELLKEGLLEANKNELLRTIARSRTLTVLDRIDGVRKASVLRFLYETKLIDREQTVVDLHGADFRNIVLKGYTLKNACLGGVDLENANFQGTNLEDANLEWVNLKGANLVASNFKQANLTAANLEHVNGMWANLKGVICVGANFKEANFEGVGFVRATLDNANFVKAVLRGANLSESHLKEAFFEDADLCEANLQETDLESANLVRTNLKGASLEGAKLVNANLGGANLSEANLTHTDLQAAKLFGSVIDIKQLGVAVNADKIEGLEKAILAKLMSLPGDKQASKDSTLVKKW